MKRKEALQMQVIDRIVNKMLIFVTVFVRLFSEC